LRVCSFERLLESYVYFSMDISLRTNTENLFPLPVESHPSFNGWFDPDVGLGDVGGRPLKDDFIIEKANAELAIYGFAPIEREDLVNPTHSIASEVGDDEIEISSNKASVSMNSVFVELLGMKKSRKDTAINTRYGNFCEELIVLPDGYDQTYHFAKNTSSWKDMSFIDVPKLRLAINIRPMRMDHSSTHDGKVSMVASRLNWLSNDNPMKTIYELFSLFQDVLLGLRYDKKFAYLPTELGGYGKPIPFSNPRNFEAAISAFKHGAHSPVIRTVIRRANRYLEKVADGTRPSPDLLLSHVSRFSSSFHDWVKGHSIYAPTAWIDIPPGLEEFRVGELGLSAVKDDVLCRLIAEGHLVPESKLQVVVEHNHLCQALLGAQTIPEFRELRDQAVKAWRKSSVFGQETYGLIKEINVDQVDFRPLRDIEISYFLMQVKERKGLLKALFRHEPVYKRDAIDHVYRTGPMFVRFHMVPRNKIKGMQFVNQTRFREDFVASETRQGEEETVQWVSDGMVGDPPQLAVNDDHIIISKVGKTIGGSVIVTDDIALCKRANNKTGRPVFRVPTEWYYRAVYYNGTTPWMDFLEKRTHIPWTQFEDSGSLESSEEYLFSDGVQLATRRRMAFSMTKAMNERDKSLIIPLEDFSDEAPGHPDNYLFDRRGIVSKRRKA
jgi:hypothetical protein